MRVSARRPWFSRRAGANGSSASACGCEADAAGAQPDFNGYAPTHPEPRGPEMPSAAPGTRAGRDLPCASTLCELAAGGRCRVRAVCVPGSPQIEQRLACLGFVPGASVQAVRAAPLGDPVVFRVCDYEICLRKDQARAIEIELDDHAALA